MPDPTPLKRPRPAPGRRLARFLPAATRRAVERYGFAYADILTQWPAIVGPDLARDAQPERIKWPRPGEDAAGSRPRRRSGGTLIVRVNGPMAVEIQHMSPLIMERINAFYGYFAIGAVKIVQGPLPRREVSPANYRRTLDEIETAQLETRLEPIRDDGLRHALGRLGRGVLAR